MTTATDGHQIPPEDLPVLAGRHHRLATYRRREHRDDDGRILLEAAGPALMELADARGFTQHDPERVLPRC
jgi:hypothetical protein